MGGSPTGDGLEEGAGTVQAREDGCSGRWMGCSAGLGSGVALEVELVGPPGGRGDGGVGGVTLGRLGVSAHSFPQELGWRDSRCSRPPRGAGAEQASCTGSLEPGGVETAVT